MWDEKAHPRDKDGKFSTTSGGTSAQKDFISLPDEQIPKSVGAKWKNHKISLPDGNVASFVEGSRLQNKQAFAGMGCKRQIDCVDFLVSNFGGNADHWMKVKAIAEIRLPDGEIQKAEIHWYEEPTVGKVMIKRKKICE